MEIQSEAPVHLFEPLLGALRANMEPGSLKEFLRWAESEVNRPAPAPGLNATAPAAEPGELTAESETREVAAWCVERGLNASVVGQWVWVDPHLQAGLELDRAGLHASLTAGGFGWSQRRQSYFHTCGVSCRREPGDKRRGGKLERFHGVSSAVDAAAGRHDPRPAWQLAKAAKAKARRSRKS